MGIVLIIGMMLYSVGMCIFFQRFGERSARVPPVEHTYDNLTEGVVIPDRVPAEWVDAYRSEQGG